MKKVFSFTLMLILLFAFTVIPTQAEDLPESSFSYSDDYVMVETQDNTARLSFQSDCDIILTIENGRVAKVDTAPFGEIEYPTSASEMMPYIKYESGKMIIPLWHDGLLVMGVENLGAGYSAGAIGLYSL